ncbi:hypothetical protein F5B22DRAFT_354398 [Xylaria bambusicola]|uniref:uncharacterized protein n=1 Tax=Xylaria bambusicola TaxID=326684 RepID=UPI002007A0CE|nr:uncharacterized protein F5B22DRAFT_354398 [Xylaria bambusicola]KAI0525664.1 hypothetical protein F5B22DRAFT_354398 [Xylaria bambusicola]
MGRHEPLTSLALGRSPYDDVVAGEGEPDPQEPPRVYDEHGRVFNEESKKMNKDIIRAHNEVMLVIGVAEQDPGGSTSSTADNTRLHNEYENSTGRHLLRLGRVLVVAGIWGVHGVRQRILVYRETATIPFLDMIQRERRMHSASQLLFSGMPSFFSAWSLQWYSRTTEIVRDHPWLRAIIGHVRFHLQIYVAMQRLDLISGSHWFPNLNFFVPFSSSSPLTAPPPLGSPGAQTVPEWVGKIAMSLAPFAGYYLIGCAWDVFSYLIRRQVHRSLPHPWPSPISPLRAPVPTNTPRRPSFPESPTLGDADREIRHTHGPELDGDSLAINGEGAGEPLPVGTIRRQSTFSSRGGDDYATDEEDPDMVNPTLISFDVDTSESTEPPAGIWSAELRPSNSGDPTTQEKEGAKYVVNTLTSLPSLLAGDILTSSLTHALLTPFDILAFRAMARAFARKFSFPMDGMFEVSLTDGLVSRMLLNLFQAEVLKFVICFGAWASITGLAQRLHITDEQWKEYQSKVEQTLEEVSGEEQGQTTGTSHSSS